MGETNVIIGTKKERKEREMGFFSRNNPPYKRLRKSPDGVQMQKPPKEG